MYPYVDEPTFKETEWTLGFFNVWSQLFNWYSSDKVRADVIFELAVRCRPWSLVVEPTFKGAVSDMQVVLGSEFFLEEFE